MKNASGCEITGMLTELGMVPVVCSSEGSRVSISMRLGSGFSEKDFTFAAINLCSF